jgi:hypothetical protein
MIRRNVITVLGTSLLLGQPNCAREDTRVANGSRAAETPSRDAAPRLSYPRGRWRFASFGDLSRTMLWVSHILIRYSEADGRVPFSYHTWWAPPLSSSRSREEALTLAIQIAEEASRDSGHFAQLARRYSEDAATLSLGGSLGGARAADFAMSESILDALALLKEDEVSQVVESAQGFHILHRRPPPEAGEVSGARIVISYDGANWLRGAGETPPSRTRDEALLLANSIHREAAQEPTRFLELVERYSEHPDKSSGGDFGTWSRREPTPFPREVEVLAQLSVGQVAPPIDSPYGFEIVQRIVDRPRALYAMRGIKFGFDVDEPTSKQAALARASEVARAIDGRPDRFDEYAREHGPIEPEQWYDGRGPTGITSLVARLSLGEVAREPIRQYLTYVVPKRIDPTDVLPSSTTLFQLPSPEHLDLDVAMASTLGSSLEAEFRAINDGERANQRLMDHEVRQLDDIAARFANLEHDSTQRVVAFHYLLEKAERLLGRKRFTQYVYAVQRRFERLAMGEELSAQLSR